MKKYIPLFAFVAFFSCTPSKDEHQKIIVFLTEWSQKLEAKDESVRAFYDAQFVFPKVMFETADGLYFRLVMEKLELETTAQNEDIIATIPFIVTDPDGEFQKGTVLLKIARTENGFAIRDMSRELAITIMEHSRRIEFASQPEGTMEADSIQSGIRAIATELGKHYDSVVYYAEVENELLFYVVNGKWQDPYPYSINEQTDNGDYQMGVVTATNAVIVPVEYSKIYNPNGSYPGMIEVEAGNRRGLFKITGGVFVPAAFDAIYPTAIQDAFAQVKQGEKFGWIDKSGKAWFDGNSHNDQTLFKSPIETKAILDWSFVYPGSITLLKSPYYTYEYGPEEGLIIYPSFIRDLGIAGIANSSAATSNDGMGTTGIEFRFDKVDEISDRFFGLVAFFMEAGIDAREFHSEQNDLLVIDRGLNRSDHLRALTTNGSYDPCGSNRPSIATVAPGLYESSDGRGEYAYYQVDRDGTAKKLTTDRTFNFTKFVKLNESYFDICRTEGLNEDYDGDDWRAGKPNIVVSRGLSPDDLDVMRNEIFAEYGFIFKSAKWKAYFSDKPWYKPQHENVDRFLTEIDKYNITFILEYLRKYPRGNIKRDSIQWSSPA